MRQVIQDHHREVVVLHTLHQVQGPFPKMILKKEKKNFDCERQLKRGLYMIEKK